MSKNRLWTLGLSAAIVLVAIFGYLLGVSPILSQTSAAEQQLASVTTTNQSTQGRNTVLKTQFTNMASLIADLGKLNVSIPLGADMPVFLREVNALTDQAGVVLGTVTVGAGELYKSPDAAAASPATAAATTSPSPSPSPSADATAPVAPAAPAGPSSRLTLIPVQISVNGGYDAVMSFVGSVQSGERLYLVKSVAVTSSPETPDAFVATLIGYVYALPTAAAVAETTPVVTAPTTGEAAAATSK